MPQNIRETSSLKPRELEAVYAVSQIVAEADNVDRALDEITRLFRDVFIFDSAVIYLHQDSEDLRPVFARAVGRGKSSPEDLVWGDSAARETIMTGRLITHQAEIGKATDRLDEHFYLSMPMLVGGNITGALVFIRFGGPAFTNEQVNLAQFITTHVSQLFEQKRLGERIADLEAERRLARLQDDFVAMVSHELKTPLGFIKGYSTTLLREDTEWDSNTRKEFLEIIDDEADRLSELIENLLDSYRLKSGRTEFNLKPMPLAPFFKGILDRLSKKQINLDIDIQVSPTKLTVFGDGKRLTQVVDNLISNASKYAPNSTVKIHAFQKDGKVHIDIADNGPGISEEHLEHIFKQFYRVPERSAGVRGTGLGLYICKHIIEGHGGKISIESEVDKGTTFHILLEPAIIAEPIRGDYE
jgi:signal transduction histidine kinase